MPGELCSTTAGFDFVSNAPVGDTNCSSFGTAIESTATQGVQVCGDRVSYLTLIPRGYVALLFSSIEKSVEGGDGVGVTGFALVEAPLRHPRDRPGGPVVLTGRHFIRVIVALGLVSGAAVVGASGTAAQEPQFDMGGALGEVYQRLDDVDQGSYEATSDRSVPDEGDPIEVRRASVLTFDIGRSLEQDELAVDIPGISILNEGNADIGRGQSSQTIVMVELDRPPELTDNEISNVRWHSATRARNGSSTARLPTIH